MSIFRSNTVGSWTRGGQALVHNVRMSTQVFVQTMVAGLVLWIGGILYAVLDATDAYDRFVLRKWVEAALKQNAAPTIHDPLLFRTPSGVSYWTSADALLNSRLVFELLKRLEHSAVTGAIYGGLLSLFGLACAWYYFFILGKGLGSNQFVRGARMGSLRQLRGLLFWKPKGCLRIAGLAIPREFEPEHFLIEGGPGAGKTNQMHAMLQGVRRAGKRAIIYDTAGSFVEHFYRPGIDVLLNPLDERCAPWSVWLDTKKEYHFDQIAESLIADPHHADPFWSQAARVALVAILKKLAREELMLTSVLLDIVTRTGLKGLVEFVRGTDAASVLSLEGEKTSAGIQAELGRSLRAFRYLDDCQKGISIRDWVAEENDDSWLFITARDDQLATLRPLVTVWLDIAISAILSLHSDRARRLFVFIDELPTLQRLPSLLEMLSRARKYGGCAVIGFQSFPQVEAIYGIHNAKSLVGTCTSWTCYRANDTETAEHVSRNLGMVEQVEANEGLSYGVNDMRDGVNLSRIQVVRPLVIYSEILNLDPLCGYLRLGRSLPVLYFQTNYLQLPNISPSYIERQKPPLRLSPLRPGPPVSFSKEKTPPRSSGQMSFDLTPVKDNGPSRSAAADLPETPNRRPKSNSEPIRTLSPVSQGAATTSDLENLGRILKTGPVRPESASRPGGESRPTEIGDMS